METGKAVLEPAGGPWALVLVQEAKALGSLLLSAGFSSLLNLNPNLNPKESNGARVGTPGVTLAQSSDLSSLEGSTFVMCEVGEGGVSPTADPQPSIWAYLSLTGRLLSSSMDVK